MALRPAEPFDPALPQRLAPSLVLAVGAWSRARRAAGCSSSGVLGAVVVMAGEWARLAGAAPPAARPGRRSRRPVPRSSPCCAGRRRWLVGAWRPCWSVPLWGTASPPGLGGGISTGPPAARSMSVCRHWPWSGCAATRAAGAAYVLWLLLVVWATDICAYFVGRVDRRAEAGAADQPGQDLGRPAGRDGRCRPGRRPRGPGAGRRLLVRGRHGAACWRWWRRPATCSNPR